MAVFKSASGLTEEQVQALIDVYEPAEVSNPLTLGTITIRSGTGSPEGVVTAVVGSQFIQTDGAANSILWTKETGAGNTGWVLSGLTTAEVQALINASITDFQDSTEVQALVDAATGTNAGTWQLDADNTGPKLKNNSGVLEIKNDADNAFLIVRALDPVGSTDVDTKGARDTAIAAYNPSTIGNPVTIGTITIRAGTSSPEGVVTAVVGSQFLQTDGTSATGVFWVKESGAGNTGWVASKTLDVQITFSHSNGESVLTTGVKKYVRVPFAMTLTGWEITSDVSGSVVVDVWKDVAANFPPTVADTITASAKPTLSSAQRNTDSTLTGWTVALAKGDYLAFNIDSATTVTNVDVYLYGTRD